MRTFPRAPGPARRGADGLLPALALLWAALMLASGCGGGGAGGPAARRAISLKLAGIAADSATLAWGQPQGLKFACYSLRRSNSSPVTEEAPEAARIADPSRTSYTDTGLDPGELYFYRVYALAEDGSVVAESNEVARYALQPETIAFCSDRAHPLDFDIYVMNPDGSGQRPIIQLEGNDLSPSWSPKKDKLVFISNRDGDYDIYLSDPDGGNVRQLTFTDTPEGSPTFSPDGEKIAFVSWHEEDSEICVLDLETGEVRQLTHNDVMDGGPVWASDWTIYFVREVSRLRAPLLRLPGRDPGIFWADGRQMGGGFEIWAMDPDGQNQRPVREGLCILGRPSPSPTARKLAFSKKDSKVAIYVLDLDTGELRKLTEQDDSEPAWSRDETKIAFTTGRDGDNEVFLMDSDGSNQVRLTDNTSTDGAAAW